MAHQNSLPYGHRYTPNTADFFKWSRNLLSLIKYMSPAKKFGPQRCTARSSKCHPGMEPDKVTPTFFFLCKIIQKFFHLSSGFHILAIQKNIFMVMGVSMGPRPLRSFWLMLELKEAIFNQFFIKFYVFNFSFLRFVYTSKH